jgi:hypothetical protein
MKKLFGLIGIITLLMMAVSTVGAQDATQPPPMQQPQPPGVRAAQIIGDIVAQETGLDRADIVHQVMQGQTLADIIQANGGDVQSVITQSIQQLTDAINQAAADGTITQTRADNLIQNLPDVVTRAINGALFPNRIDMAPVRRQGQQILLRAAADATHLTPRQILQQLGQGKTFAEVITANGGNPDDVVNATVAAATEQINAAVADNRLGQDQADMLIAGLPTFFTNTVNGQNSQQAVRLLVGAALIRLAAQETGLTAREITQELRSGTTLGAVLAAHNVDTGAFIDKAVSQLQQRLNQAVRNGRLTQEQVDLQVAQFRENLTNRLNQGAVPEPTAASV